ncbi:Transposable element P transposase [Pseudolycoriella hygida]|uniref:Transposable element P transposase n=1 Tax=Pseudolycoriella hygida TaxID=35572 RepID=A0A9Q0N346_9DIPT|nr:Transposable element P transposase [Pseudolycoriella hygida]
MYSMEKMANGKCDEKTIIQFVVAGLMTDNTNRAILLEATNLDELKPKLRVYDLMETDKHQNREQNQQRPRGGQKHSATSGEGTKKKDPIQTKRVCRKPRVSDKKKDDKGQPTMIIERNDDANMLIPLTVNKTTFEALLDTGSPYTMMDEPLYEQLQLGKWSKSKVSVRGFAGKTQHALGEVEVNVEIGKDKYKILCQVVRDGCMTYRMLLGRNILRQAEVLIRNGVPTIVKAASDGPENDIMTIQMTPDEFKADECPGIAEMGDKKIKSEIVKLINEYKPAENTRSYGKLHPTEHTRGRPSEQAACGDDRQTGLLRKGSKSTGSAPFRLMFGTDMKNPETLEHLKVINDEIIETFDADRNEMRKEAAERILKIQAENQKGFNKNRKNPHLYYPSIMNPIENDKKDTIHNLRVPFEHGWTRELVYSSNNMKNAEVYYVCPAGNRMRTKREVFQNLGNLNIWNFSFAKRPLGCNGEIIRTASARGCRDLETAFKMQKASVDVGNSSAQQSICSLITEATDNSMNIRSPGEKWWRFMFVLYVSNCFHDLRINEEIDFLCCFFCKECLYSSENYTHMDEDQLRQEIAKKDDLIKNLRICLLRNESEMKALQTQIKTKPNLSHEETLKTIELLFPMLSKNQINIMTNQKKRVNWTCEEISTGFALSFFSRRGYCYLIHKLHYPLPSIRTLQLWSQKMTIGPGIIEDSFVVMAAMRSSLTEGESQVILAFDEMKCKERYEVNKTLDCVMGPHSQMQVAMVRGLFYKFKQPIFVDFDMKMSVELLNSLIKRLYAIKFNVVGIVNDNGGGNVGLWTKCNVNYERPYISHPITKDKIFMFSDAPHLLKLLRNWFIDGGLLLSDGTELNQYRIRQLLESNTEISPLYKLSLHHLEVKGAERQCVRLASELFSHTVAESVRRNFPKDAVAHKLADFIELVNNWFDIMNSYTPNGIAYKAPYGKDLEEQNRVLDEMYWTIKTMKCFNKKGELQESLQISQKGILMSITSIKGLRKEMEEKFKFRFILTHRTNQDFEENFFSQIRGRNGPIDHPSPVECLYTIKAIILGKNPGIGRHLHSNTIEQDPEEYVSATFMRHLSRDENIDGICERNGDQHEIGNIELLENDSDDDIREKIANDMTEDFLADYTNDIKVLPNDSNGLETCIRLEIEIIDEAQTEFLDDLDPEMAIDETAARKARSTEDGLEYLAGWIAWKFKKKHPEFSKTRRETLSSHITDHTYAKRIGIESSSWIDRVSYGGLTKPSNEVMQWVRRMENVFIEIHGDEFNNRMNIRKLLISELEAECKEVPSLVINLYARSRIYMRCKFLNKQREEKALLLRVLKRPRDSLSDISRAKIKKMQKIVT